MAGGALRREPAARLRRRTVRAARAHSGWRPGDRTAGGADAFARRSGRGAAVERDGLSGGSLSGHLPVWWRGSLRCATHAPICNALPLDPARDLYGSILFQSGRFRRLRDYLVCELRVVWPRFHRTAAAIGSRAIFPPLWRSAIRERATLLSIRCRLVSRMPRCCPWESIGSWSRRYNTVRISLRRASVAPMTAC